jgi:hypothetical protein
MANPTPELVQEFWDYMSGHYGSQIIKRSNAWEMKIVARFLSLIRAMDVDTFMEKYATTLGRRIYIPFEIGEPNDVWDLWEQLVVCIHEHQHVHQYKREGRTFMWKYLLRSSGRAHYEADAYRCNLEMHYWRFGRMPDTHRLASMLKAYKCNTTDIAVTEKQFNLSIKTIEHGAIINDASRRAIKWLEHHAPELQEGNQ